MIWLRMGWWIFWRAFLAGLLVVSASSCLQFNVMTFPSLYTEVMGTVIFLPYGLYFGGLVALLLSISMILLIRVLLLLRRGRRNFQRYGFLLSVLCVTITGWLIAWQSGWNIFFAPPIIILMCTLCYMMSYFPAFAVPLLVQRRTRLQAANVLS